MQACDRCHARKTRCDRRIPRCGACEKVGAQCLHVDKLRSRNLPRGYVESLETDLRKAEDQNLEFQRQISALQSRLSIPEAIPNRTASVSFPETDVPSATNLESEPSGQDPNASMPAPSTSSGRTPADDAVATEVGYLTLTAAGETRYLGSSSGMGLASIISSVLDPQQSSENWPKNKPSEVDERYSQLASTLSDAPFPPKSVAVQFIEAYFQHTHVTFPLLHRPTFLTAVDQIYNNSTYYVTHTFDAFAFDMVLSIGSSNFNRFEESMAGTATHYARAQKKMHEVLNMGGLVPLQAILLLSQHGIFSNLRDTSASIWHLIGIGARICFELGLHLEPKRIDRQTGRPVVRTGPTSFEAEMRKRTFWCFYNLDRVVSFTLGRPVALRDEDIDISLPSNLNDEEFGPDRPIQISPGLDSGTISPFLHVIKIRHLSGKILSTLYAAKQSRELTVEQKTRVRGRLYEELVSWRNETSSLNLAEQPSNSSTFISCFLSPEWYTAVFNNALLLLYRPSPYLPYPVIPTKEGEEGDLQRMFYAAKSSITSYHELHRKRRLNYSWITLHGIFIVGLAYVYGIGLALKDPSQAMPIPDYLEIINDTRACSNILVAICERWSVARSSCELFNRLSNAVIRDAINAAAKKDLPIATQGISDSNHTLQRESLANQSASTLRGHESLRNTLQIDNSNYDLSSSTDQFDHMFVADKFRQYSTALEMPTLWNQPLPSELVMGLSQDWPFEDGPFTTQGEFGMSMQGIDESW